MSELEDIFKDNLKDFNVNPTDKVWKGIKSNLWYSDIQNVFRNFTLQPANSVWRAIAFRLWFKKFITYSPSTFNVYYVFSIVLVGISSLYFYNQSVIPETISNEVLVQQNSNFSQVSNSNSVRNATLLTDHVKSGNISNDESENNDFITAFNNTSNLNEVSHKKEDIINTLDENIQKNNSVLHHEPILITDNMVINDEFRDYSSLSLLKLLNSDLKPEFNQIELIKRDIPEFKNRLFQWSLEGFILPMTESAKYKVNEEEYPGFGINYKEENPSNSYSGGLMVEAKYKKLSLQTGITYSKFIDRPSYQTSSYVIDTNMVVQIIPDGYYNYFSVPILDLDTYLSTGDSVFIMVLDSNFISMNDTLMVEQVSVQKYIQYQRTANSFSYIELPLMLGYSFEFGKLNLSIKGGIIAGLLTYAEGSIPSPYSEQGTSEIIQNTHGRKFVLSGIGGIELGYDVSSHVSIVTSPVYRFNINSVLKDDYIVDQRFKSFGVKFGVKYHF